MTDTFDAVLADMLGESTLFLHEITDYHTRLAAAHAAEVAERDARIAELKRVAEDAINLAEAAERDARRLREVAQKVAVIANWYAEEHGCCPLSADERAAIDAAIATAEAAHED